MDFVAANSGAGAGIGGGGGVSGATSGAFGSDNGPILYSEPNRTSAIDDIRSVVIYIFIATIFFSFFIILPGIRNEKFPTFFCITTSLVVTSIIVVSLFGTSWHVGEAPISAAYKAFSVDRIQGELSVRCGLQSVNISLMAHKYYILDATNGPIIMENAHMVGKKSGGMFSHFQSASNSESPPSDKSNQKASGGSSQAHGSEKSSATESDQADDPFIGKSSTSDEGASVDPESEVDEAFEESTSSKSFSDTFRGTASRQSRSTNEKSSQSNRTSLKSQLRDRSTNRREEPFLRVVGVSANGQKYTVKRVDVDINYNERFYWIGPNQMRQEYHKALERGLPYPILTAVEYLSQDEGGFSWSRQYRLAGYYSYICLWLSLCVCVLMFVLHCAAPKYGIYTMQALGCLLLFTNFTYATLVPRGEQKLVIPFEGQSLSFGFGWNFWMVMFGGGLSLTVGTIIVIIDSLFPNFIFTTVLDVDFDSRHSYYRQHRRPAMLSVVASADQALERPIRPPFYTDDDIARSSTTSGSTLSSPALSNKSSLLSTSRLDYHNNQQQADSNEQLRARHQLVIRQRDNQRQDEYSTTSSSVSSKQQLATVSANNQADGDEGAVFSKKSHSESSRRVQQPSSTKQNDQSSPRGSGGNESSNFSDKHDEKFDNPKRYQATPDHYGRGQASKNTNLKITDHRTPPQQRPPQSQTQPPQPIDKKPSNSAENVRL